MVVVVTRGERHHGLLVAAAGQLAADLAVVEDDDPVGHPDDLGQLGGDEDDRHALGGEVAHELVDGALGTDVDAAGGLVHDDDPRLGEQPLRQHDLLLVAAREEAHLVGAAAGGELQRGEHARGAAGALPGTAGHDGVEHEAGVGGDGLVEGEALGLAVLGDEGDAGTDSLAGGA